NWVHVCQESHRSCVLRRSPFHVPLTVIDCVDEILRIKPEEDPFLALSYVWGPQAQGLDKEAARISFTVNSCPRTIQDAIKVTKCLGYRYLWVDRYCIDQVHSAVKMVQLAMMDLIYRSADLTIIAAAGSDDSHGLPGAGTVPRKQQDHANLEPYSFVSTGPGLHFRVQSSKWASRGWTYQEEQLSTRRLYFTDTEVALVC
ncbi:heterokaryon incompatibility protein-domain-containing protein, partial [Clohesyomyces aquaticus]